jgi:hypothetical protein
MKPLTGSNQVGNAVRLTAALALAAAALACHAQSSRIDALDPRALPLGDGRISAEPKRGFVFSCQSRFRGGGAQHAGDWIHGSTWDSTRKVIVRGDVRWPNAVFGIATQDGERRVTGNGLPVDHTTGIYPVQRSDPAFGIDRNPNSIREQQVAFSLPLEPALSAAPSCVPMGMIGVALSGVALFNALDDAGRDAVAHEVQDHCNGHPERQGRYHYHGPTPCLAGATSGNALIGYALDGFGITSSYDENGRELTNADLDECHGRVSRIEWNGRQASIYHYVMTREYPYTVGCFRGRPVRVQMGGGGPPDRDHPRAQRRPPPEAIDACAGLEPGSRCGFTSPRGDRISGSCRALGGATACAPERQ